MAQLKSGSKVGGDDIATTIVSQAQATQSENNANDYTDQEVGANSIYSEHYKEFIFHDTTEIEVYLNGYSFPKEDFARGMLDITVIMQQPVRLQGLIHGGVANFIVDFEIGNTDTTMKNVYTVYGDPLINLLSIRFSSRSNNLFLEYDGGAPYPTMMQVKAFSQVGESDSMFVTKY